MEFYIFFILCISKKFPPPLRCSNPFLFLQSIYRSLLYSLFDNSNCPPCLQCVLWESKSTQPLSSVWVLQILSLLNITYNFPFFSPFIYTFVVFNVFSPRYTQYRSVEPLFVAWSPFFMCDEIFQHSVIQEVRYYITVQYGHFPVSRSYCCCCW